MTPDLDFDSLAEQSISKLTDRFHVLYGQDPPKHIRRGLLTRAVAHRLQENAAGGPDAAMASRLGKLAEALRGGSEIDVAPRPATKAGTRLIREWQGETHTVTVTDAGFLYRGKVHRSLSGIARQITGTRWSGPAFFGLDRGRAP
ncbi:DUF2924 domain-containing protein [Desertibaculum subflavum]|uniref:DUF2924 domain-containing protein n=1 Tax=Desertibaculum subflavum TaxID=2268458 RepID=UPI0013C5175B